jgi:murein DD-endopeptidase MepM/ murein hydrolase activator NlpD
MIATLLVLQIVLPLALIGWLAFAPQRSKLGFAVQAVAVVLALLALWREGVWIVPPWWTTFLYAALAAAAVLANAKRAWTSAPRLPHRFSAWTGVTAATLLSVYAAAELVRTEAASRPPAGRLFDLAMPLGPGDYLILNGGANLSTNAHADALDQSQPAHRAWWGTGYGVDFVAIDAWGLRASGLLPTKLDAYRIFGMPVVAPCAGEVVAAVDGYPDMTPPAYDRANLSGNYLILACADVQVVLAHFKRASLTVRRGDIVASGLTLGRAGNSGGTDEPHLHVHVQLPGTADAPMSGRPLPATYDGRFLVRGDRIHRRNALAGD